ncbi:MAG: PDZ domain-containing protein [Alphaproteobacteria bacterium]|nr:PDZ domain-containing protein [Alphaproteobacteria bacterium]
MRAIVSGVTRSELVGAALIGVASFGVARLLLRPPEAPPPAAEEPQGGVITLSVVDPEGEPLADCAATAWLVVGEGRRRLTAGASQACTPEGALRWTGREAGQWRIMMASREVQALDETVTLEEGGVVDLGQVQLGWGGTVYGFVREGGVPVPKAEVRSSAGGSMLTGPDGAFIFRGQPVGALTVQAFTARSMGEVVTEVQRGERSDVEIALEPLPPRGTIGVVPGEGAIVTEVLPGSPAEGALQVGDEIVAVDGQEVGGDALRLRRLAAGAPGEVIALRVRRGDDLLELTLTRVASDRL